MSKMSDLNFDTMFAMFKGEPGTRKSTAAASFPTPQYWFSFDQKMESMLLPMKNFNIDMSQVEYDDYKDFSTARTKLEKLQVNCPFRTVIFDSITSAADAMNRQTIDMKSGETSKSGAEKGIRVGGISVNTMEDYKAEASAFQETIAKLKDIHKFHKCNIILLAHVIGERKEGGSSHFARIIVTGGKIISAKIPAVCGEVYHFDIVQGTNVDKPGEYSFLTTHTGYDFARTGLKLPNRVIFNNDNVYTKYLLPAMEEMKRMK